jgi:putative tricarboxylic transport membrane protein
VPLVPALVGLFAVSEAYIIIEKKAIITDDAELKDPNWHDTFDGVRIALSRWWHIAWRRMGCD